MANRFRNYQELLDEKKRIKEQIKQKEAEIALRFEEIRKTEFIPKIVPEPALKGSRILLAAKVAVNTWKFIRKVQDHKKKKSS